MRFILHHALTLAAFSGLAATPLEATEFSEDEIAYFRDEVKPILQANCFKCHGGLDAAGKPKIRSGLQIISRRGILQGGSLGPAYNEANPEESLILQMISYKDEEHEMPPSGQLPVSERETLARWVNMGMPWTPEDAEKIIHLEDEDERQITEINEFTKSYWSYKPLTRPEVPVVDDPAWQSHPIDAFIHRKLEEEGLSPNPPASPRVLVRRAYHNLTGLPPSPAEAEQLEGEFSESAWLSLIDQLLESPHYGEKWARHWLDVVRYAESNGFERDSEKEMIWRYRDYVIRALNEDKPYDQFIREQLAGDELDEVTPDSLIATGYHRLMQWDDEPADREQHVYDVLDDNVRVTAEGLLAMTLGCARCHDHKGDPISQKDYYSFMAFFHNVTPMDKGRVIEEIPVAMPRAEFEEKQRAREARRQRLASRILELEERAKEKLAARLPGKEVDGTTSALPTLISVSRERPQAWLYTTRPPEEDWFTVGFRPADWKQGLAPFGGSEDDEAARTPWTTGEIWMQKTFGLTSLPSALRLTVKQAGEAEVYLNGQLIFESRNGLTDYQTFALDEDGLAALQTGRNVVAVHAVAPENERFIDLGLEADFGSEALSKLLEQHRDEVFSKDEAREYQRSQEALKKLESERLRAGIRVMMVQERGPVAEPLHVHLRGSVHAPGDVVPPAFPSIFGGIVPEIPAPAPGAETTGRRRVLADWIAGEKNPRTARVAVNRLWQHHFGRGLCPTPNDFGFLGETVSHPDLLDWLACEFMDRGWSFKAMHRLIMSSKTYQLSSGGNLAALETDPTNRWHWRFNMRRFSAEEVRDSMLAVTGRLNRRVGGPSFFPALPEEVLATSSTGAGKWGESSAEERARRSVYITIKRSLKPPALTDFDFADTDAPCAARFVTTVPDQALALLNSRVANDHAAALASRLCEEAGEANEDRVRLGLKLVTCREPSAGEVAHCLSMMDTFVSEHGLSRRQALDRFCLLVLNLNEFIYLD